MSDFNKTTFISNIYTIAKKQGIKLGELEKESGVSVGYLSRLNKGDSIASPSIDFLFGVAKALHVSVDSLCACDYSKLTPTEEYIMGFLDKLATDSEQDKLAWEKQTIQDLRNVEVDEDGVPEHPLFTLDGENGKHHVSYHSQYSGEYVICGDCFRLSMPVSSGYASIYLMNVGNATDVSKPTSPTYELYMVKGWKVVPLISSDSPVFKLPLERIYTAAAESCLHPKLDDDVMSVIDDFMNDIKYLSQGKFGADDDSDLPF